MKIKKRLVIFILMINLMVIIILGYIYLYNNPFLQFSIKGSFNKIIEVNTEYIEEGYIAEINHRNLNNKVKINNNININKVGTYEVVYQINYLKTTRKVVRMVSVVDTTPPIITLTGDSKIIIDEGNEYIESGYHAIDNYDDDITDKVKMTSNIDLNTPGEYQVIYSVSDSHNNSSAVSRKVIVKKKEVILPKINDNDYNNIIIGPTYINGILIVNKQYALPSDYGNGIDRAALDSLHQLQNAANIAGFDMPVLSAYRSYDTQKILYNSYYAVDGSLADTYSAKPGHSEHQTGLAFDVGAIDDNYGTTPAGMWLKNNCAQYGFIIRYPEGKESITGYKYEPWHIRYLGPDIAIDIMDKNITLEEYLGI